MRTDSGLRRMLETIIRFVPIEGGNHHLRNVDRQPIITEITNWLMAHCSDLKKFSRLAAAPGWNNHECEICKYKKGDKDMFKLKGVHHLGLPVNNLDRAKQFYTEVLGMTCAKVDVDIETGRPL